jgi:hypothetical protein
MVWPVTEKEASPKARTMPKSVSLTKGRMSCQANDRQPQAEER